MYEHTDGKQFSAELWLETMPTSAGTFTLRRAHYFSETGTPSLNAEQQSKSRILSMKSIPANKVKD